MSEKVTNIKVEGSLSEEQAQQVKALLSSTRELIRLEEGFKQIFGSALGTTVSLTRNDCGSCNCATGQITCVVYELIFNQGGWGWAPVAILLKDCTWLNRLFACISRLARF